MKTGQLNPDHLSGHFRGHSLRHLHGSFLGSFCGESLKGWKQGRWCSFGHSRGRTRGSNFAFACSARRPFLLVCYLFSAVSVALVSSLLLFLPACVIGGSASLFCSRFSSLSVLLFLLLLLLLFFFFFPSSFLLLLLLFFFSCSFSSSSSSSLLLPLLRIFLFFCLFLFFLLILLHHLVLVLVLVILLVQTNPYKIQGFFWGGSSQRCLPASFLGGGQTCNN